MPNRYFTNASVFKDDAFAVLEGKFADRSAFDQFYENLSTPERKNEFLRVCCRYRYLVKHGDWKLSVPGVNEVIDYLTNSYKLVAVFSLIESLSELRHQDFYEWLCAQPESEAFPIPSKAELASHYSKYKESYGAIRRCVSFFSRLDPSDKEALCNAISKDEKPTKNIKKLAEYLYDLRSKFVHEAELVLELGPSPILSVTDKGVYHSTLTVQIMFEAFENGLLSHFRRET